MKAAACVFLLLQLAVLAHGDGRIKLDRSTPAWRILSMDPADVDPSGLLLTSVESLHSTGTPQNVDIATWRLEVSGPKVRTPLALSYEELGKMQTVRKPVLLICPATFFDYLEWEGVPLATLLEMAGASDYERVSFTSVDGYSGTFTRQEAETHLILIATGANGVPLPRVHGFPARVVAEGITGSRWVKYVKEIRIE